MQFTQFDMQNLVKVKTCDKSQNGTSIDVILTNKPKSFYRTIAIETGLSDHHKLIATFLRCQYQRLPPKTIIYRSTKNLDNEKFLKDIENIHVDEINRFSYPFTGYLTLYKSVVDRHCPIKKKRIRGNEQPFMDKDLSKAIKDRSRIRNKYNKWKSRENYIAYQNIKKTCKFLTNRAKQNHFDNVLKNNNIMTNKDFWKLVRPALSEKNSDYESKIVLKENEEYISDEKQLVEIFNNHYINIVENSTGRPPTSISAPEHLSDENIQQTINKITEYYKDHPSIKMIKEHNKNIVPFKIPQAEIKDINRILKNIKTKKSAGPDLILPSLVKLSADIIDKPLTDIINNMIDKNVFPLIFNL